jgi:hypothetical protein
MKSNAVAPLLMVGLVTGCPGTINPADYVDGGAPDAGILAESGPTQSSCADVPQDLLAGPTCSSAGSCHSSAARSGNLDLESPGVASRLVGVKATSGGVLIDPAKPEESLLYRRVTGAATPRMPSAAPPLDDAKTACLLAWIKSLGGGPVGQDAGPGLDDASESDASQSDAADGF